MLSDMQKAVWEAVQAGEDKQSIANRLGISRSTVRTHYTKAKARIDMDPGIADALGQTGLTPDTARYGYRKVKDPDTGSFNTVMWRMPPQDETDFLERVKDAVSDIAPAKPIARPKHTDGDLCTVYPIADAHIGMMAWGRETGEKYNTDIACSRLREWVGRCVDLSPASDRAVILDVGDLMHADDQTNQTPASKHVLDVDTRYYRTVETTIAALAAAIEYAAQKHAQVTVRILRGNHNPHSFIAVLFALRERYRGDDRITVECDPAEFWVDTFGLCLFAAHHGDKANPQRAVNFLADDYAVLWGKTKFRHFWTGHLHHHASKDIGGVQWEQLRPMTARDAYAVSHAYCARSQIQGITFHKERGEIQRVKVGQ